jgi:prepilin peptidase CpaA
MQHAKGADVMGWLGFAAPDAFLGVASIQLACLLFAAWADLSCRLIPDCACVGLGVSGAAARLAAGPQELAASLGIAVALFGALLLLHARGMLGGGDVKLLAATALGLPAAGAVQFIVVTAFAGGGLALLHLGLRWLPRPARAPAGSSAVRRVYAAERWRILRRAPLPYGIAIACGGAWVVLTSSGT